MHVPLLDLKAQFATIRDETLQAVQAVLESQQFILGPDVKALETAVASYCGCRAAIGMSSGTDALLAALMALNIGPGDEVITTPYTFFATAGSIWRVGAKPVFVDIRPDTFNIDTDKLPPAITARTKAIMPVHLFGQMAAMDPILDLARRHNLSIIEDAAQAIGATYKGHRAGALGTIGCFSFFPSKNLGGLGDGGMVTTQDDALAERLRVCRNHGAEQRYFHKWVGGNFRLDTLQATGLLVKLKHLEDWSAQRRRNAALYDSLFADCHQIVCPAILPECVSIYNQYVIRVPRRDELAAHLAGKSIGHAIYYPLSLHQQECFSSLGYKPGDFPQSEQAAATTLALPIYPELSGEQIRYVAQTIKDFLK